MKGQTGEGFGWGGDRVAEGGGGTDEVLAWGIDVSMRDDGIEVGELEGEDLKGNHCGWVGIM